MIDQPPQSQSQSHPQSHSHSEAQTLSQSSHVRSVKRPRPVKSCTECRKRKLRCDRLCPCSQCQKSHRICRYTADADSTAYSDGSDADPVEQSARPTKRNRLSSPTGISAESTAEAMPPYSRNGEHGGVSLEDLAARMDRLEKAVLTKSPARTDQSSSRTHLHTASPNTIRDLTVKSNALRTRFYGQNSPRVLLNLFGEAKELLETKSNVEELRELFISLESLHKILQLEYRKLVAPISVFVDSMLPIPKRMTDVLPNRAACDRLLAAYIDTNEIIYRIIHVPSFQEQYDLYWEGKLQSDTFLPQLLTLVSIGARFATKSKGLGHERQEGVHIPTGCALVRAWLDGLRGKQLVELTTLQTEVLLLHAHRMMSLLRAHDAWTQLGYIVRMAMTMGLHRDPSEFPQMTVFRGELRRRLWFTILDMDLHISLACNLPCLVREGDYTCRPPQNLDDADIYEGMQELPRGKPIEQYTECQIHVYASMTLPARMKVTHLVNRIDTIRDYQEVLEVGARLDRFLEDINYVFPRHGLDDRKKSKQWRRRVVMDMHVRRPLLSLYRPFALGVPDAPPQILRAYLRSSMVILRYLDEVDPSLPHFQEISDMYQQILKQDIIQACFSVCFYIQNTLQPPAGLSPDDGVDEAAFASDSIMLGTPARLVSTVQKSLDLLVRGVGANDVKDIVSLSVVFYSVQGREPKAEDVIRGLQAVLNSCLRNTNTSPDEVAAFPHPSLDVMGQTHLYGQTRPPFLYHGNTMTGTGVPDELLMWDLENNWSSLLPPSQPTA